MCNHRLDIDEYYFYCQLEDDDHAGHYHAGASNDFGGESDPTKFYEVRWFEKGEIIDATTP